MTKRWEVTVFVEGNEVLTIGDAMLSGHQEIDQFAEEVRSAGQHLLSFIGEPSWQPIETAPKNGTEILAYCENSGTGVMLVRHIAMIDFLNETEIEKHATEGMSDKDLEEPDWFFADFVHGGRLDAECAPTHWMPVPLPARVLCTGCGKNYAEPPDELCEGCEAYREHQQ